MYLELVFVVRSPSTLNFVCEYTQEIEGVRHCHSSSRLGDGSAEKRFRDLGSVRFWALLASIRSASVRFSYNNNNNKKHNKNRSLSIYNDVYIYIS